MIALIPSTESAVRRILNRALRIGEGPYVDARVDRAIDCGGFIVTATTRDGQRETAFLPSVPLRDAGSLAWLQGWAAILEDMPALVAEREQAARAAALLEPHVVAL